MKRMMALWLGLCTLILCHSGAWGYIMILKANQVLENNGNFWVNPQYAFEDDALNATVLGTANGVRYLRLGLEDSSVDTANMRITGVGIYAIARSSNSRSKARLRPYFNEMAGLESPNLNIGTSEVLRSFDITLQDSLLPDRAWNWQDLTDLSIRFAPRTASYFYSPASR